MQHEAEKKENKKKNREGGQTATTTGEPWCPAWPVVVGTTVLAGTLPIRVFPLLRFDFPSILRVL